MKAKRSYVEQSESEEASDEDFDERPAKKSKKADDSGSDFDEEEDIDELKREAKKFVKSKA